MSETFTEGLFESFAYGRGFRDILQPAAPAAGANFSLNIDPRYETRLLACRFHFVADGNAANRFVHVDYENGQGVVFCSNGPGAAYVASDDFVFNGNANLGFSDFGGGSPVYFPLNPMLLVGGERLQINVTNKQAGDQLSSIVFVVERFEVGPLGYPVGRADAAMRRHYWRPGIPA